MKHGLRTIRAMSGSRTSVKIAKSMKNVHKLRIRDLSACILAAMLCSGSPATAADPPDFTDFYPAGVACDFDLSIEGRGGNQVSREFTDKNGNVVRLLTAGKGPALTFTNDSTDATLSLKSDGSVRQITPNSDGSSTYVIMGHNILILFPTDIPAGPSTTLYAGRVVFTATASFDFEVQQVSGKGTDICAALSG
ncbi:MAG: hypothetical protein ABWY07_11895 [Burkholderiales bacterium]